MKKLRIAHITSLQESVPPHGQNGLEQLVFDLIDQLIDLGHEVTLFGTADSQTRARLIPVWPTPPRKSPYGQQLPDSAYTTWSVAQALKRQGEFDIIHDHTRFVAAHFATLVTPPIVSTLHHPVSFEVAIAQNYDATYQSAFKNVWHDDQKSVHAVVVSEFQKKVYQQEYGFPPTLIHNGMNLTSWPAPNTKPEEYLAFLGYMTPNKGVAEAIQAVLPTTKTLLIAGPLDTSPENQTYFKEKVQPFLGDRIKYLGPLDNKAKQAFLGKALATLMPIQWDEPFGLVAIESLASGTPVIAWNRAAMPEIITQGVSGFLVNSIAEMTEKIALIDQLDRLVARKQVEDNFSAPVMAKKYEALYLSLLK